MAFQEDSIYWVEVEKVVPNPFQPRREFDEEKLKELSESIRMYGVLQPLTVTRNEVQRDDGTFYTEYELIAGERRLRASRLAGLSQVPVIIREGKENEQEKLELAIIENLQREDLNSVDRALAFKQLAEVFGLSHTLVAKKVGRSREYVSNTIRLLGLPDHMLDTLRRGKMTEGHARTLLMLNDRPQEQEVLYREMLLKKLSVREVEKIARRIATDKIRKKDHDDFDNHILDIERRFTESLGTRVQIQKTNFGGKLTIDYFSLDDLEQLLTKVRDENLELGPSIYHKKVEDLNEHTPLVISEASEEKKLEFGAESKENFQKELAKTANNQEKSVEKSMEKPAEKTDYQTQNVPKIRESNLPNILEKSEMIEYKPVPTPAISLKNQDFQTTAAGDFLQTKDSINNQQNVPKTEFVDKNEYYEKTDFSAKHSTENSESGEIKTPTPATNFNEKPDFVPVPTPPNTQYQAAQPSVPKPMQAEPALSQREPVSQAQAVLAQVSDKNPASVNNQFSTGAHFSESKPMPVSDVNLEKREKNFTENWQRKLHEESNFNQTAAEKTEFAAKEPELASAALGSQMEESKEPWQIEEERKQEEELRRLKEMARFVSQPEQPRNTFSEPVKNLVDDELRAEYKMALEKNVEKSAEKPVEKRDFYAPREPRVVAISVNRSVLSFRPERSEKYSYENNNHGKAFASATTPVQNSVPTPASAVNSAPVPKPVENVENTEPVSESPKKINDDDGGLYSINHFSI